jgi:crotonobetainyl-CoA:carnitine CoA-transferase CaiB-like acyl-CoA transferase
VSSLSGSASAIAASQAPNAANSMVDMSSGLLLQFSALAALIVASFVAMLA